jgi:hypothetical protein
MFALHLKRDQLQLSAVWSEETKAIQLCKLGPTWAKFSRRREECPASSCSLLKNISTYNHFGIDLWQVGGKVVFDKTQISVQ